MHSAIPSLPELLRTAALILALAFPLGAIPAAVTGLICAVWVRQTRRLPLWFAAVAALASAAVYAVGIVLFTGCFPGMEWAERVAVALATFSGPGLIAVLGCGWILRRLWPELARRRPPTA